MGRTSHRYAAVGTLPVAAWLVLAGTPASVRAQDQPQSTENGAAALAEVTVTATRREESLSKVPISVTALTQEALDDRGIKDFSEVARFTPGDMSQELWSSVLALAVAVAAFLAVDARRRARAARRLAPDESA